MPEITININTSYRPLKTLVEVDFEVDGITYLNTDWAGLDHFQVLIRNFNTWLVPGIDFNYLLSGGFELIVDGQPGTMTDGDLTLLVFF